MERSWVRERHFERGNAEAACSPVLQQSYWDFLVVVVAISDNHSGWVLFPKGPSLSRIHEVAGVSSVLYMRPTSSSVERWQCKSWSCDGQSINFNFKGRLDSEIIVPDPRDGALVGLAWQPATRTSTSMTCTAEKRKNVHTFRDHLQDSKGLERLVTSESTFQVALPGIHQVVLVSAPLSFSYLRQRSSFSSFSFSLIIGDSHDGRSTFAARLLW